MPSSVQDALDKSLTDNKLDDLSNQFNKFLDNAQTQINEQAGNTNAVDAYKNYLQNELAKQQQNINTGYNKSQQDLANQMTQKNKAISDYIANLQQGLQDYQKRTGDYSNLGALSDVEKDAIMRNANIANPNSGAAALNALSRNASGNSKLDALSQQAQAATLNQARGLASQAQQNEQIGKEIQAQGQKAQADAYKKAGDTINKNQTDTLNKLQQNQTDAQKQLADAYNNSTSNLSKQEQDYVNKAQDTLRNAKVPEKVIQNAANSFASTVQNYIKNNKISEDQKNNLVKQLESIWRIAVGTNPSDMDFSNQIASSLMPVLDALGVHNVPNDLPHTK